MLLSDIYSSSEFSVFNYETTVSFHFKKSYLTFEKMENMATYYMLFNKVLENRDLDFSVLIVVYLS